ncbi:MAG: DUF4926 domain-containing protein [Phycisphaeraceae bacterium]
MVALLEAMPDESLHVGDVGTIVHVYDNAEAYEVEFVNPAPPPRYVVVAVEAHRLLALNYYDPQPLAAR